ncbi:MAG: hypothetical protein ACYS0D_12420, partial [Planctomycetota bacterium]
FCHGRGESDAEILRNPDERTRRLERRAATGDDQALARLAHERFQAGQLILPQIALAAAQGNGAALAILEVESPDYFDYVNRNSYKAVLVLRPEFLDPATGRGKYLALGAQFSIMALAAMLKVLCRKGLVDETLRDLPGDAMRWIRSNDRENLGQQIADRYLDILEAMPQRHMRLKPGQYFDEDRLTVAKRPGNEVAHHLAHAISMSSGGYRTRWAWGYATERAADAMKAAFRACRPDAVGKGECLEEIENEIRAVTVPWLLSP